MAKGVSRARPPDHRNEPKCLVKIESDETHYRSGGETSTEGCEAHVGRARQVKYSKTHGAVLDPT